MPFPPIHPLIAPAAVFIPSSTHENSSLLPDPISTSCCPALDAAPITAPPTTCATAPNPVLARSPLAAPDANAIPNPSFQSLPSITLPTTCVTPPIIAPITVPAIRFQNSPSSSLQFAGLFPQYRNALLPSTP